MAQATDAQQQAVMQAASAQQQVEAALRASREIELSVDTSERQQAFQIVVNAKRAVQANAMATSAYVLEILALSANQAPAITAAKEAANDALALLNVLQNSTRDALALINEEIQVAMVRARLARAVTRVAIANSDVTGVAAPDVARQAVKVVQKRVLEVLVAAGRAAAASPQAAHTIAVIARSDALAASVASRIVDAYIRLAIAQATEGTSNPALAARIAAADQLQNAVSLAQEAEAEASLAASAESVDTIQQAALRTEARVYLGAAWAQSATSWAYAAWAWSQGLTEVAEAAEAAAIATESTATMVEATIGVVATNAPSAPATPDLPMNISSLALTTLSPSAVAAEEAAKEAAKEAAEAETETEAETPAQDPIDLPVSNPVTVSDDNALLAGSLRPSTPGVASPSR